MKAAAAAYRIWREDDFVRRLALREASRLILVKGSELAGLITAEQGKPIPESRAEVRAAGVWLRYFADMEVPDENSLTGGDTVPFQVLRRPLGVVAAITPWNYPLALAAWKIAPALRAGNSVVLKPSPFAPLATLALGEMLRDVFPAGVLNVVTGLDPLGAWMTTHPVPRKVSFTGSVAAGRRVAAAAGANLKRVTLELGGNDPAIVLDDANVDDIADSLFWGAFTNNGQMCIAVKRVYVVRHRYRALLAALAARARAARVGPGTAPGVQLGPVANQRQLARVGELVRDALASGASLAAGGSDWAGPGFFYPPTILGNVDDGVRVVDEEQFGPVVPVIACRDASDAVARANFSGYGLTASIWSADADRAATLAKDIEAGQVSINAHAAGVRPDLPFSGHKDSGLGVENGPWGLWGFTDLQVLPKSGSAR